MMTHQDYNVIYVDNLTFWTNTWQLPLNISKRKVLHLDGINLQVTNVMKALGILIDAELKFHAHTTTKISKVNKLLGTTRKSFI